MLTTRRRRTSSPSNFLQLSVESPRWKEPERIHSSQLLKWILIKFDLIHFLIKSLSKSFDGTSEDIGGEIISLGESGIIAEIPKKGITPNSPIIRNKIKFKQKTTSTSNGLLNTINKVSTIGTPPSLPLLEQKTNLSLKAQLIEQKESNRSDCLSEKVEFHSQMKNLQMQFFNPHLVVKDFSEIKRIKERINRII